MIRVFKSGEVSYRAAEELRAGYKVNRRSIEKHEKAV